MTTTYSTAQKLGYNVTLRQGREPPNANGYFVQRYGITIAGPFETFLAAWGEADRLAAALPPLCGHTTEPGRACSECAW